MADDRRLAPALALMLASGFAGLGYQIVWTQQSAIWLGHESAAVLAVVAAFFGGLAVGAFALGSRIDRSPRPARWYAACELVIASWGLLLAWWIDPAAQALLQLTGERPAPLWQWLVAFLGTFLLLLPATAAMGATLPAMEGVLARLQPGRASLAALYAGNTLGAVLGVLAAAFWLVPEFGLVHTSWLCVGLNLLCAAGAWWGYGAPRAVAGPALVAEASASASASTSATPAGRLLWLLAATGLLGIGYEVVVIRVISQVAENTVYTFAMLLAVYLVGTALGAAAAQRGLARGQLADAPVRQQRLLAWLAAACLLGTACLWAAPAVKQAVLQALGGTLAAALLAEAAMALAVFLLPTVMMGAVFSHLAQAARRSGLGFGRALGVNTLGAAWAPPLFGVLLVPALGPKFALLGVALGYLVLAAFAVPAGRPPLALWVPAAAAGALALIAPPLAFVDLPEGGRILSYREGAMGAVSVVEDARGVARLHIDNRQQEGSSDALLADARQALLPMLLHPAPRHALFLGLGSGVTATAAAEEAQLRVDVVELLPEVIEASTYFRHRMAGDAGPAPLNVVAADARRHLRATRQRYDLIVSDNFHPARSGSGALYTVEHFRAVQQRLADGGLFCQWLPLHQMDLGTLRSIVRAFVAVHPNAWAVLATYSLETPVLGLVARADGGRFMRAQVQARLATMQWPRGLSAFGLPDEQAVLGSFVAGPRALAAFSAGAELNTDDRPVVAYHAPRITYRPDSSPGQRLVELLPQLGLAPEELLSDIGNGDDANRWQAQLTAHWRARDRFLAAGLGVRPVADPQAMLAQVRVPLLDVLRIQPDFRPAYDPLLRMAQALAARDPAAAQALLQDLQQVQPARPEAASLLAELEAELKAAGEARSQARR